MAGNFRNLFVGKGNVYPAISRGDNIGQIIEPEICLIEGLFHHFVGQFPVLRSGRPYE